MLFIALSPPISLHIFYYSLIISEIQQTLHIITKIRYPLYIPLIICKNVQKAWYICGVNLLDIIVDELTS